MSIYTEGNQGKTEKLIDKTLPNYFEICQGFLWPNFFYYMVVNNLVNHSCDFCEVQCVQVF